MNVYEKFLHAKAMAENANTELDNAKIDLYSHFANQLSPELTGSNTFEQDGYKIKITKKVSTSVDQKLASVVEVGFTKKYQLSKSAYNKLNDADKKRVDECLTVKPAKPGFEVEKL